MKADLSNANFNELLQQLSGMASAWRKWRALLVQLDEQMLKENDSLGLLFAACESEDVWQLLLSCTACSLYSQSPGTYETDSPDVPLLSVVEALVSERGALEEYKDITRKMCKERYQKVIGAAPRLLGILRHIPAQPPITVLDSEFCMQMYGHDHKKFLECVRK